MTNTCIFALWSGIRDNFAHAGNMTNVLGTHFSILCNVLIAFTQYAAHKSKTQPVVHAICYGTEALKDNIIKTADKEFIINANQFRDVPVA